MSKRHPPHHGLRRMPGFALVELTFALVLLTLITVWGVQTLVDRTRDAAAQASGTWLVEIRHGVLQMLGTHFDDLAGGHAPKNDAGQPLFNRPLAPTLAELARAGHVPEAFPSRSALGFAAGVAILRDPRCPGQGCRLDAVVYARSPVLRNGASDTMAIAQALMAMQGWGGTVDARHPARLVGASLNLPNPLQAQAPVLPPGTLVAWAGLDRESTRQYLRVGDDRDPAFQGNVTIVGTLEGSQVRSRSDIQADGSLISTGDVVAGRNMVAGELLHLGQTVTPGQGCTQTGAVGHDAGGQVAACVAGTWQIPTDGFGGAYGVNSKHGCQMYGGESMRNPRTGDCSCPGGYQAVPIAEGGRWYERGGYTFGFICIRS